MNETAAIRRHQRLRRAVLLILDATKAAGWMRGRKLFDWMPDQPDELESDDELLGLLRDLEGLGLLESQDTRSLKSQREGLNFMSFRITAKGTGFLAGLEPKCPLVEDPRI